MQEEKILSRAVFGEYIEVNCGQPDKKQIRHEKLTHNWNNKTPVDWFKLEEPYLRTLEVKDSDLVYLGDGRFELTFWKNGNNIQLIEPNDKSDYIMFVIRLQIEVKRDYKDFNQFYWKKIYKRPVYENTKSLNEFAVEWRNNTTMIERENAAYFAQIKYLEQRNRSEHVLVLECRNNLDGYSILADFNRRTLAVLNVMSKVFCFDWHKDGYARAIATAVHYCPQLSPILERKFPSLSKFLNALANMGDKYDEMIWSIRLNMNQVDMSLEASGKKWDYKQIKKATEQEGEQNDRQASK